MVDVLVDEATRSLAAVNLTVVEPVQSVSDTYCVNRVFSQSPSGNAWRRMGQR